MKSRGAEEVVRAKVLIIKGNRVVAVCKRCNAEVELPLHRSPDMRAGSLQKSPPKPKEKPADAGPPLVLRK
jgi:hypothetical protein